MKTNDLIGLLATDVAPVDRHAATRRFGAALPLGIVGALLIMSLFFGIRPDIRVLMVSPVFWAKIAFPFCIASAALAGIVRLGRPGRRVGYGWLAMGLPFVVVMVVAAGVLWEAQPGGRVPLLMGKTWKSCAFNILLLSVPTVVASFWALKSLAPTRLRLAGAVCGLLGSAMAAVVYSLHCPEMSPAFWSVWYTLGMLLPAAIGAWFGPRVLRW